MTDIISRVNELQVLNNEIKRVNNHLKDLRTQRNNTESFITSYIHEKKQPGFKYKGLVVTPSEKYVNKRKGMKQQRKDLASLLRDQGVNDVDDVSSKVLKVLKGSPKLINKLKIQNTN